MNAIDKLFELYNEYFDRLAADFHRLNQAKGMRGPGSMLSKRMNREVFEDYLLNGDETESKRCFLRRILRGNEAFYAILPGRLKSLAERAA